MIEKKPLAIECWRNFPGYEELYQVSMKGEVRSLNYGRTGKIKTLKPEKTIDGYLRVKLCKDKKEKNFKVHRLVAQAFIPNPGNLPQVNHLDENKENNHVSNLQWCTSDYNNRYGTRLERITKAMINGKKSKRVGQYTLDGELVKLWSSTHEVERQLGWSRSNISKCCRREYKTAYGYVWRYV